MHARNLMVSFSGIDGAGKSTQIAYLRDNLVAHGISVAQYAFWDDVAVLSRFRELSSLTLFKGEKGIGTPEKPVKRRDKNVRSWYLTGVRMALYLLDAAHLTWVAAKSRLCGADVVIFDRYLYDELVNLPIHRRWGHLYARVLLGCIPRPAIGFVLDAEPEAACGRKPEYPLEFVRSHRQSYFLLAKLAREVKVIAPSTPSLVQQSILAELQSWLIEHRLRIPSDKSTDIAEAI
jgi:thymidylate kinase